MMRRRPHNAYALYYNNPGQHATLDTTNPQTKNKVCIFAYGQTGSGKTHTMLGAPGNEGITPRAISQIFETSRALGRQGWAFTMQVRVCRRVVRVGFVFGVLCGSVCVSDARRRHARLPITR
jgi:energy-coupling factor transporter ATP-binding protein EcfA2